MFLRNLVAPNLFIAVPLKNFLNSLSEKLKAFYGERAKGGVGLIVTGGFSPNKNGRLYEQGIDFVSEKQIEFHKPITKSVHKNGGKIILQILQFIMRFLVSIPTKKIRIIFFLN